VSSTQPYAEHSIVRTLASSLDDKGRTVAAGTRGAIVHVYPERPDGSPVYIVEVLLIDEQGRPSDCSLFDARHDQLKLE
jgi:hypothetical protein